MLRQDFQSWNGQPDSALTATFGFPQKTLDLAAGKKLYEYDVSKNCTMQFEISPSSMVSAVNISGSNIADCPRKKPGGGTF
jgi:hypothetical protein